MYETETISFRTIKGRADAPPNPLNPSFKYRHIEICRAELVNGRLKWVRVSRKMARRCLSVPRNGYRWPPRGSVAGRFLKWGEVCQICSVMVSDADSRSLLAFAQNDPTAAPILADAMQEAGVPESHPVLGALRNWVSKSEPKFRSVI